MATNRARWWHILHIQRSHLNAHFACVCYEKLPKFDQNSTKNTKIGSNWATFQLFQTFIFEFSVQRRLRLEFMWWFMWWANDGRRSCSFTTKSNVVGERPTAVTAARKEQYFAQSGQFFSGEVLNVLNFRLLALPVRRIHDAHVDHVDGQLDFDQARIDSGCSTFFSIDFIDRFADCHSRAHSQADFNKYAKNHARCCRNPTNLQISHFCHKSKTDYMRNKWMK